MLKFKIIQFATSNLKHRVRNYSVRLKGHLRQNKMYAWQVHSYGEDLQLTPARIPIITQPNEVLIKVEAASINPIDTSMKHGYGRNLIGMLRTEEIEFPLTLGRDFAGTIIDKGYGVDSNFKIGDLVYGIVPVNKQGSHAENVIVDDCNICHRPEHLSPAESCSILYTAMTAWSALYITGNLFWRSPKNVRVLILGASGGVGTIAVQLLKSQGAKVIGTCATDALEIVKALGVDNVHDYTSSNYISNVASEGRFDIILDCAQVGHEKIPSIWNYDQYITLNSPLLKNTDEFGVLGGLILSTRDLLLPNIMNYANGWVKWGFFWDSNAGLQFIDKLIKRKQIIPVIHREFVFNEIPKAYETLEKGHLRGKIIINYKDLLTL